MPSMPSNPQNRRLTSSQRNVIGTFLLKFANGDGKPTRGSISAAAIKFGVSRRTVCTIWKTCKEQLAEDLPINIRSLYKGSSKKVPQISMDLVQSILPSQRKTIRALSKSLCLQNITISKSSVGRLVLNGLFKPHTNSIKPSVNPTNRIKRLRWSLNAIQVDQLLRIVKFKSMSHVIHIDEKWFFMTQPTSRYYLLAGEEATYRACQSKSHITKVMFVCAVGRPWYASNGDLLFDGKIGLYPLTIKVAAQRRSKNREAGVLETKAINQVTRRVYKECLINEIIPTIKAKWPSNVSKHIILQQDNATPHITNDDPDFREAAVKDGFNFVLVNQPPQSPDCNVNDLGWFRAIQSLQQESPTNNIDGLVKAVQQSFIELDPAKLNKVFLTLQSCMVEILKQRGHNNYKTPHMHKDKLARMGQLPTDLVVEESLVRECLEYLMQGNECHGLDELINSLGY